MCNLLSDIRTMILRTKSPSKCENCEYFENGGCGLAQGIEPPKEVQEKGCEKYKERDWIPF